MALQLAGSGKTKNAGRVLIFKQARKYIVAVALLAAIPILFAGNSHAVPAWSFNLTANLPTGLVGVPYSGTMVATGGTAPYKFALTDGNLPAGLALNSTTGAITGTPSAASTTYVWIKATDANGKFATIHPQI